MSKRFARSKSIKPIDDYLRLASVDAIQIFSGNKNKSYARDSTKKLADDLIEEFENIFNSFQNETNSQFMEDVKTFVSKKIVSFGTQSSYYRLIPVLMVTVPHISTNNNFLDNLKTNIARLNVKCAIVNCSEINSISEIVLTLHTSVFKKKSNNDIAAHLYTKFAKEYKAGYKIPMVIILKDFQNLDIRLFSSLVSLMHENINNLSVILICSYSSGCLPKQLPPLATDFLEMQHLSFTGSQERFYNFIEKITYLSTSSFKIGPKIIKYFIISYINWHLSLENILKCIKIAIIESSNSHFFKLFSRGQLLKDAIQSLSVSELNTLKMLPSLKKCEVPSTAVELRRFIEKEILNLDKKFEQIIPELKFLNEIRMYLKLNQDKEFFEGTWIPFLGVKSLTSSREFALIKNSLLSMTNEQASYLMSTLLKRHSNSQLATAIEKSFHDYKERMIESNEENSKSVEVTKNKLISCTRSEFSIRVRQCLVSSNPKKFDLFRKDFASCLEMELNKIDNPFCCCFNEIACFDNIELIKSCSCPSLKNTLINTISSPHSLLMCKCCKDLSPTSPDISIAFKIISESSKIINLKLAFDEFQAFLHSSDEPTKKRKKKVHQEDQEELLARFLSAINDLEYLGFLKHHPSKIDHIIRLVWA